MIQQKHPESTTNKEDERKMQLSKEILEMFSAQLREHPNARIVGPINQELFVLRMTIEEFQTIHLPGKVNFLGQTTIDDEHVIIVESAQKTLEEVVKI